MSTTECTVDSFKPILKLLINSPELFTADDLRCALRHLFTPDLLHPAQIGAFLAALHTSRVERRPDILAAAARFLLERATPVEVVDRDCHFTVDVVGTGGDGHNTFNVSTTAAVVAAGAGARVVKHGGRASTSASGSADLLQSLSCVFPPADVPIPNIPFTFLFAPSYHPAMAMMAPYRRALPFRTILNMLGPLVNPARPHGMVLGVAERDLGEPFARTLRENGVERALVVCGEEGLDEISCAGDTHVWKLQHDTISVHTLHPSSFGLPTHPLSAVASGTPVENAQTFRTLLTSGKQTPDSLIPVLDFVLMNAAALLVIAGRAEDWKEGTRMARDSVESGKAWEAFIAFRDLGESGPFLSSV